jgi:lipopolysaccharide transport system ATP-binding protein
MSVISVEKLSKRYIIGHQRDAQDGLRHALEKAFRNPYRWVLKRKRELQANREEFWALKDVSFEVEQGDVVGIIGRNGAGKSTLLKILSRITEPTTGRIRIGGRVASLLEVGTGFHQELTGRENIFLNGAILGMGRLEIKRKFDEIIAFAEIEKFLDTPVKRYSSGMYVRLAFAVAAHLEPEILIVDEVLAVGDTEFQKKCLGKMGNVARQGRTVLFVSHNMAALNALCPRSLYLERGCIALDGPTDSVVHRYLHAAKATKPSRWRRGQQNGSRTACITGIELRREGMPFDQNIAATDTFSVRIDVEVSRATQAQIAVRFTNDMGIPIFTTANSDGQTKYSMLSPGHQSFEVEIPRHLLAKGTYSVLVAVHQPLVELFDVVENEVSVTIEDVGPQASTLRDDRVGLVNPILRWTQGSV